jgi:hypothetical protein
MSVCSRVGHRSLVLVVFIGGVTSAEIAALRFLSAQVHIGKLISIFFLMFIEKNSKVLYIWKVL